MDWMYANCSTTAQRGALDWKKKFRDAVAPVFRELYARVKQGKETEIVLKANSAPDYREKLDKELSAMRNSEMWRAGAAVRALRPENQEEVEEGARCTGPGFYGPKVDQTAGEHGEGCKQATPPQLGNLKSRKARSHAEILQNCGHSRRWNRTGSCSGRCQGAEGLVKKMRASV
jgi:hypothetical protein